MSSHLPSPGPESGVPEPVRDEPSRALVVALPREIAPYARTQLRWRPGCGVEVLRDGDETYPAMLGAIAAAKTSIALEVYILADDTTGRMFKDALIERARAGVACRLIYDAVGSFGLPDRYVAELMGAGVEVADFNPIAPWRRRFRLSFRDHRKILVVDNIVAFTGGLNIADDYASEASGGKGWHDMHCKLTGPIVLDLARMFRRTWLRSGGTRYEPIPSAHTAAPGDGNVFTRLLDNTRLSQRGIIRRTYLHVIRAARKQILIENAYFIPDRAVRRALTRSVRRGVDVSIIVPGRNDVRLIEWASLYVLRRLARRSVKIFRWRGPMMHAKTAVIDGTWSTIGSYNFDAISRFSNLELTVEILDTPTGQALVRTFEHDLQHCDPFNEDAWEALPWWTKVMAWVIYRFRQFL